MHVGRPNIGDRVAKSGLPQILERQGSLRVELAEILGLHTLYAFSEYATGAPRCRGFHPQGR